MSGPYYYIRSGYWDIKDKAEVKLPDETFYQPGTKSYAAALTAMTVVEQGRWIRLMQTVEIIMRLSHDYEVKHGDGNDDRPRP